MHRSHSLHGLLLRRGGQRASVAVFGLSLACGALDVDGGQRGRERPEPPRLDWQECGGGFECASARVPLDYARPHAEALELAVTRLPARDPARRIGVLFVSFGGPGVPSASALQASGAFAFDALNERFDLVAFDSRGLGPSQGAVDCRTDPQELGLYARPFARPEFPAEQLIERARRYAKACVAHNAELLPYLSTANGARDMDLLREALGEPQLSYFGYSHGSVLGATYASLFPTRYRALVLDAPLDPEQHLNRPARALLEQTAAAERALARFFQACAADPAQCFEFGGFEFGGGDPMRAFDALLARAGHAALEPGRSAAPGDGDELLALTFDALYSRDCWSSLGFALASFDGDLRAAALEALAFGCSASLGDAYFVLNAAEQRYDASPSELLELGEQAFQLFPHFWWNSGYAELPYAFFPAELRARDAFYGPFRASDQALPVLVVGTTYDPAAPYAGAERLVEQLGNARLLTLHGDGHAAYGLGNPCIDAAVNAYFTAGTPPEPGAACEQGAAAAQASRVLTE